MAEERTYGGNHSIKTDKREKLSMTGVTEIISFNENVIEALTDCGVVIINGEGLHINQLSTDKGNVDVDGKIDSIMYEDERISREGFLGRLFK